MCPHEIRILNLSITSSISLCYMWNVLVTAVDECVKFDPCMNDATCNDTDGRDNYVCHCVPGYTGRDCETGTCY